MDFYAELLDRLRSPDIQRSIVQGYDGEFSLGLASDPTGPEGIGIRIGVPPGTHVAAPTSLRVLGRDVPISVVEDRFSVSPFR